VIKELKEGSTPADIRRATKACLDQCGCSQRLNDDDVIVVDSEDLDAVIGEVLDQLRDQRR
jgi:hypothetical protein